MLDVDILKLCKPIRAHRELSSALISQQLLVQALLSSFIWFGGHTETHEWLRADRVLPCPLIVRLSKSTEWIFIIHHSSVVTATPSDISSLLWLIATVI